MTLKYICSTGDVSMVRYMPTWKCTNTEVTKEKAEASIAHLKNACFGCSSHSSDCSIARAVEEITEMISESE